jgi:hypothetical protein
VLLRFDSSPEFFGGAKSRACKSVKFLRIKVIIFNNFIDMNRFCRYIGNENHYH